MQKPRLGKPNLGDEKLSQNGFEMRDLDFASGSFPEQSPLCMPRPFVTERGRMKSSSALTTAKTAIRFVRWGAVLALVYVALSELIYAYALDPAEQRPAPLAVVQNLVYMLLYYSGPSFLFVAVGAKIAPRARLTTAVVLAAMRIPLSLWSHVLFRAQDRNLLIIIVDMLDHPWVINYRHFALEALGAVLGVVYIYWSEKAKGMVASAPPIVQ
jgi:hypothetical protein